MIVGNVLYSPPKLKQVYKIPTIDQDVILLYIKHSSMAVGHKQIILLCASVSPPANGGPIVTS